MATKKKLLQAAAGTAAASGGAGALNVEDVFSTYLYTGNDASKTITNGIDLAGEGGLVWRKERKSISGGYPHHVLIDTERGGSKVVFSDLTNAEIDFGTAPISSFNSNGFTIIDDDAAGLNLSANDYASWTFRKAPKFFDVQTWSGNSTARTISHNLGTTVGTILVKKTSAAADWIVYHRSTGATQYLELNNTNAAGTYDMWNDTAPTSTEFSLSGYSKVNETGHTYVAYLFAHNDGDGEFGPDGDADIIKCGSFTSTSGTDEIDLGFEPQWILIKRADASNSWVIVDELRGNPVGSAANYLEPNGSFAESTLTGWTTPTPTGFTNSYPLAGGTFIYIAIRRGPMAVPTDATDVFDVNAITGNGTSDRAINTGFVTDVHLSMRRSSNYPTIVDRLRGHGSGATKRLATHVTNAEQSLTGNYWLGLDTNDGYILSSDYENQSSQTYVQYAWKRAPNFCDVVAYTGGGYNTNVKHNLGVTPELCIAKSRTTNSVVDDWYVWCSHSGDGNDTVGFLNSSGTSALGFHASSPSSTDLYLHGNVAYSGYPYIMYLFASLDGVSKVGSYTGNGSTLSVDCGFSSGPRFVLIKRTDSNGHWCVYDSERGITSTTSPVLRLNNTDAENSSYDDVDITPSGNGFIVDAINGGSVINASGGSYIFYAIA